MNLYLDTSAIVKQYVNEMGSKEVVTVTKQAQTYGTSIITKAETIAAFAKSIRTGVISQAKAESAVRSFYQKWPKTIRIQVNEMLIARAGTLAWDLGLRGYDAVHLATALMWQESMNFEVKIVTFDKQLWNASKNRGLGLFPKNLNAFLETADPTYF